MRRARNISRTATHIHFERWLALSETNARMTTTYPALEPGERAMKLTVKVPRSLFQIPQLTATVEIADPDPQRFEAKVKGLADQLSAGLGLTVTVADADGS